MTDFILLGIFLICREAQTYYLRKRSLCLMFALNGWAEVRLVPNAPNPGLGGSSETEHGGLSPAVSSQRTHHTTVWSFAGGHQVAHGCPRLLPVCEPLRVPVTPLLHGRLAFLSFNKRRTFAFQCQGTEVKHPESHEYLQRQDHLKIELLLQADDCLPEQETCLEWEGLGGPWHPVPARFHHHLGFPFVPSLRIRQGPHGKRSVQDKVSQEWSSTGRRLSNVPSGANFTRKSQIRSSVSMRITRLV